MEGFFCSTDAIDKTMLGDDYALNDWPARPICCRADWSHRVAGAPRTTRRSHFPGREGLSVLTLQQSPLWLPLGPYHMVTLISMFAQSAQLKSYSNQGTTWMKKVLIPWLADSGYFFWKSITLTLLLLLRPIPSLLFQLFGAFKNKSHSKLQQWHWYHLLSFPGTGIQHNWLFWYFWAEILLVPRSDAHTGSLACLHSYPSISVAGCPLKQGVEPISTRPHASPILAQTETEASDTACPRRSIPVDNAAKVGPRVSFQGTVAEAIFNHCACAHSELFLVRRESGMMGFCQFRILLLKWKIFLYKQKTHVWLWWSMEGYNKECRGHPSSPYWELPCLSDKWDHRQQDPLCGSWT